MRSVFIKWLFFKAGHSVRFLVELLHYSINVVLLWTVVANSSSVHTLLHAKFHFQPHLGWKDLYCVLINTIVGNQPEAVFLSKKQCGFGVITAHS